MSHSPVALGGTACFLLLLGSATGRAELIQWSYNWSRSPVNVVADSPGTGYIALTDEGMKSAAGNSYLVATNLQAHSTAPVSDPDVFTNKKYTLTLFLQDQSSGKSGTVSFTGEFNGNLTAQSSNITNTFVGPTTQTLTLGQNQYTVTIGPYAAPGPTGAVNFGSIAARAEVTVTPVITGIFQLPEPSSSVLAFLGIWGLLLMRRRVRMEAGRGSRRSSWRSEPCRLASSMSSACPMRSKPMNPASPSSPSASRS
jgi:hypothetical protein